VKVWRRRARTVLGVVVGVAAGLSAARAQAQSGEGPWEISLAGGLARPQQDGTYRVTLTPSLDNHPEATGSAVQTLGLDAASADAYALTVGYRIDDALSVGVLAEWHRANLSGASSPYAVTLTYDSRQPPDYQPRAVSYDASQPWPDTRGSLDEVTIALNVGVDLGSSAGLAYRLSGGLAAYRLEGSFQSLAYTAFSEGGHATLDAELHDVGIALAPAWTYGADIGGEVSADLGPSTSLFLDGRLFWGRSVDLAPRVDRVLNAGALVRPLSTGELQAAMALRQVSINPSFAAVMAGLRVRL
jgi:hypothetical protein